MAHLAQLAHWGDSLCIKLNFVATIENLGLHKVWIINQCYLQTEEKMNFKNTIFVRFYFLKVEAAGSLNTWQNLYQITWYYISINGLLPEIYIFLWWHWEEENCSQIVFGMKPLSRYFQTAAEKRKHSDFRGSKPYPGYRTWNLWAFYVPFLRIICPKHVCYSKRLGIVIDLMPHRVEKTRLLTTTCTV